MHAYHDAIHKSHVRPSRCPSTDEWVKNIWCIYSVGIYSAVKKMKLGHLQTRNENGNHQAKQNKPDTEMYILIMFIYSYMYILSDSSCTRVHVYVVVCAYVCGVYVYEKEGKINAEEKLFGKRKRAYMCREEMRWNSGQGGQIQ